MNLSGALDIVTNSLATQLTPLRVQSCGGRFTKDDLGLLLGGVPCVLVSVLSLINPTSPGRSRRAWTLRLAAYCLGADTPTESRAVWAMDAAFRIVDLLLLPGQFWGRNAQELQLPDMKSITADNLYTGYAENLRVALWAVAWTQTFIFDNGVSAP